VEVARLRAIDDEVYAGITAYNLHGSKGAEPDKQKKKAAWKVLTTVLTNAIPVLKEFALHDQASLQAHKEDQVAKGPEATESGVDAASDIQRSAAQSQEKGRGRGTPDRQQVINIHSDMLDDMTGFLTKHKATSDREDNIQFGFDIGPHPTTVNWPVPSMPIQIRRAKQSIKDRWRAGKEAKLEPIKKLYAEKYAKLYKFLEQTQGAHYKRPAPRQRTSGPSLKRRKRPPTPEEDESDPSARAFHSRSSAHVYGDDESESEGPEQEPDYEVPSKFRATSKLVERKRYEKGTSQPYPVAGRAVDTAPPMGAAIDYKRTILAIQTEMRKHGAWDDQFLLAKKRGFYLL